MRCPACETDNEPGASTCYRCGLVVDVSLKQNSVLGGRYEILGSLGTGGMGTVYKAHDRVLDEIVALKVLRPEIALDPDMGRRFQLEIKLARKVTHKNVCRIYEYGDHHGLRYLSMEFVSGTNLKQVLQAQGGLFLEGAFQVAQEIAAGLQAIHEVGVIHRDLKTLNIMLDSRGTVRLMDFGIAKQWGSQATGTASGLIIGSPEYMSPEQATGGNIDFRSDVYAFGIVVYELLTGHVPFHAESTMATLYKQVNEAPQLSGPGAESIPPLLVPILRRALAKDAAGRYANVREMADALSSAQTELFPPRALTPAPVRARAADTTRRSVAAQAAASPLLLETIEELSASLGDHPGLEQLVDTVAHCGKKLTGAHSARVLLLSGSAGREWIVESSGGDGGHELRGMAFAPGEGLAPLVIESGAPLRLPRATDHPRYRPPCDALPSAAGFLCVPVIHGETLGVLEVAGRDGGFGSDDEDVLLRFARHAALSLDSVAAGERAMDSFTHTADLLVSFLERLDILYANHSRNVAAFADMIAPRLGLNEDEQLRLHFAALLHDVGKIRVDPAVLRAPAPLTPEQRRQMQEHVTLGVQLLTPLAPWADVTRIIAAHHERWDGKGYPNRLSREAIPLGSRILSVADVFDSITSAGTGATQALTAMRALGGSQFDPQVVEAFVSEQRDRQVRLAPR